MPKSFRGLLTFAIVSTLTVIVGMFFYNRIVARAPVVARIVQGGKAA